MRKVFFAGLVLLLGGCCSQAFACSCIPPPGGSTYIYHQDRLATYVGSPRRPGETIFLGTVMKIEPQRVAEGFHPDNMVAVMFSVERVWADARTEPATDRTVITIRTNETDGMCGVNFKKGRRYFVFAERLEAHYCSPTGEYYDEATAADYYKVLGEGRAPEKPGTQNKPDSPKKSGNPEKSEPPTSAERPPRGVV